MDVAQCSAILCLGTLLLVKAFGVGHRQTPQAGIDMTTNRGWLAALLSLLSCALVIVCIATPFPCVWGQSFFQICPIPEALWWQTLLWGSYLSTLQSYRYLGRFANQTTASRRWAERLTAFTLSCNMLLWIAGFSGVAVAQILAVSFWLWPTLKMAQRLHPKNIQ